MSTTVSRYQQWVSYVQGTGMTSVLKPTYHGEKVLDICVTDLGTYYAEPEIRQPVEPNVKDRVPSDHLPWFAQPHTDSTRGVNRESIIKTVRPLTQENKQKLGTWLLSESWEHIYNGTTSSDQVSHSCRIKN